MFILAKGELLFVLCLLLFPFYWALITSLKTEQEIFQNPPTFYPHILNLKSYAAQVETEDFNMFWSFGNSFLISIGATIIPVALIFIFMQKYIVNGMTSGALKG